jgi:ppGpp synthetase/RelA/SpoT-type nucleotidyltranferase
LGDSLLVNNSGLAALPREELIGGFDVADFPRLEFSNRDVKRAGEVIAGDLAWTDESAPEIKRAFQVANNWRDAHAYPMRSVRYQMIWFMRQEEIRGVTVARLKRMQAIRKKLRRIGLNLNQLQDLGGCRAILNSMADVRSLVGSIRERSRHEMRPEKDYIASPKSDGYRSHHLILSYRGEGAAAMHDDRRIEIQVRTRLQHSWATAVEAVGLFRGEYLKGSQGDAQWLRLFKLMSAEFAAAEGCPEPPDLPQQVIRISEIRHLDKELEASRTLDKLSYAVHYTRDAVINPLSRPTYYLIRFDNLTKEVLVEPIFYPKSAVSSYDNAEALDNKTGTNKENIVLVEADKLESLKVAYPNYFGDVQLFKAQLNLIVKGRSAQEYSVRPQEAAPMRPKEKPSDLRWLRGWRRWS